MNHESQNQNLDQRFVDSLNVQVEPASVDPDVGLMLRVRNDDAVAFEAIVDRYQGKIIRFMRGWGAQLDQAEDLAQDVFLRVYRARKSYQPTARFATWLYRIAHNIASNHVRDSSNRKERHYLSDAGASGEASLDHMAVAPSGFQPSRSLEKTERATMVLQALQALNERQRTAIMLSKFEAMSYQEIADTMGMSIQAVKSILSRARVNLKILLEPYFEIGKASTESIAKDAGNPFDRGIDRE